MALELRTTEARDKSDAYRLVVFNQIGSAVLIHCKNSERHLPLIEIPKFTRPAQQITGFFRDCRWTSSVLLFFGALEKDPSADYFAVLQTQGKVSPVDEGTDWFPVHHAINRLLTGEEREVLDSSYVKANRNVEESVTEPFSRLDWMRDLQDWVWTIIAPLGLELRGFEQVNGSETFCLIRFDTTIRPVWFKAVGKPNLHEFPITMALARLFPEYLPIILASQPTCQGWLMQDGGMRTLGEAELLDDYVRAALALADLQVKSIGKTDDLLRAGCRDLRTSTLLQRVDPFLETMNELMQLQEKALPPILRTTELSELRNILKEALHRLEAVRVPETLGHSDFNPGNTLISGNGCTFIDWAEAYVGHPFLTLEYFLSDLRKDYSSVSSFEAFLRSAYVQAWKHVIPTKVLAETLELIPLIAVFAYAVACNRLNDPESWNSNVPAFLRSLTRRMKREADALHRSRVPCIL
jgi:hypothetical protein